MKRYRVEIGRAARRSIRQLERSEQLRVYAALEVLGETPRPPGCVAMKGYRNVYRVRVSHLRIVYKVIDDQLIVLVVNVGHRRDVYRDL